MVAQGVKSKLEVQKTLDKTQILIDSLMQKYFGYSFYCTIIKKQAQRNDKHPKVRENRKKNIKNTKKC